MKTKLSKKAIALLRKVQKTITEEPNRLNMGQWAKQFDDDEVGQTVELTDEISPNEAEDVQRTVPACGTMGCIAGWTCIHGLTKLLPTIVIGGKEMVDVHAINDVEGQARELLGITTEQAERLFLLSGWDRVRNEWAWPQSFTDAYGKAKTAKQRAKVTCERIDYFIEHVA